MLATDPVAAIRALEALHADGAGPEHAAAGPALVAALTAQKNFDRAFVVADALIERHDQHAQEQAFLAEVLALMIASDDWQRLDAVAARVASLATEGVDANELGTIWHRVAVGYSRVARFAEAEDALQRAIEVIGPHLNASLVNIYSALGAIQAQQGRLADAIGSLHRADEINEGLGRPPNANILRNLGGVFINLGDWGRAIQTLERAEAAQRESEGPVAPSARLSLLSMLAAAHIGAKQSEPAHAWSKRALDYARTHDLPAAGAANNYAALLRDEGRDAEALALFEQIKAAASPRDRPELLGVLEKNIGETLVKLGQRERAAVHLDRARELYESADVRPKRLELYPILIDNLEALGRAREALAAMREFKALSDETITTESQTRIGELESQIDLERKTKQLAEAEAANALQRSENERLRAAEARARLIGLGMAVALVALASMLALLVRNHRIKARGNRELSLRNREIEAQRNELEQLNESIQRQSREDALTGLGNRRSFAEFRQALDAAGAATVLIMADLDHFKEINDRHGHLVGDRALRHFADALRSVSRANDVLIRWGGEEFLWVCRGMSAPSAPMLCERLLQALREHSFEADGSRERITVSLGFVTLPLWPEHEDDWETALRVVDHAVYCTKANGRDGWTGFAGAAPPVDAAAWSGEALEARGHIVRVGPPASV